MATLNYDNTKINKLYYQGTEVKKCYYQGTVVLDNSFPAPSSHTPGDTITWDNRSWLVCHYDSSANRVYLIISDVGTDTIFGSNNAYAGSNLASVAADFQSNSISAAALKMCVDVTINGVTAKVFIPSYEQMNGGFSWFNSNEHRIASYRGNAKMYWTSSARSSYYVWVVNTNGSIFNNFTPSGSCGFRPCICVQL